MTLDEKERSSVDDPRSPSKGPADPDLPMWTGALAPVLAAIYALVPLIFNRHFYYVDDSQSSAFGQYWHIGQRLLDGDWSLINPTVWQSGNYAAETSWGIFSPFLWVVGLTSHLFSDVVVYLTVLKVFLIALGAFGGYKLARTFGVTRLWSLVISMAIPLTGTTKYLDGPSWANGLMGWALFLTAWWLARRAIMSGRGFLIAAAGGFLLIGINYVHATLFYAVALLGTFAETVVRRNRTQALRSLYVGGSAFLFLLIVNVPLILTAPVTARNTGIANTGVMTVDLSDVASSATGAGVVPLDLFGMPFPPAPVTYLSWLLPLVALVAWRAMARHVPILVSILSVGILAAVIGLGPSDLGPLRFPVRVMPYLALVLMLCIGIGLSKARAPISRPRIAIVILLSTISAGFSFAGFPASAKPILAIFAVEVVFLWLIAMVMRRPLTRSAIAATAAAAALGTLGVSGLQSFVSPASPLREYQTPSAVSDFQGQLDGLPGETLVLGDPTPGQPGIWRDTLPGNMWYIDSHRAVQNAYSTLYFPAYDRVTCMTYNGSTSCPSAFRELFEQQGNLGVSRADVLSISAVALIRSSFTQRDLTRVPDGWHVQTDNRYLRVLVRDRPVGRSGGIVWTSDGVRIRTVHQDAMGTSFRVLSAPRDGHVALSRLAWPGYRAEGPGTLAKPLFGGLLTQVRVGPASVGKVVTISYHLPGEGLVVAAAAALLLLWIGGAILLGRMGAGRGPKLLRRLTDDDDRPWMLPESSDDPSQGAPGGMSGSRGPLLRLVRDQRLAFLIAGSANTVIGLIWFAIFDATVGRVFGYMVTLLFSHVASVLCAFVMYRKLVFRVRGHVLVDLLRFESVYLIAIGINAAALPLLVEFAHLAPLIAQVVIVAVTTVVSYFGHRYFSFRRSPRSGGSPPALRAEDSGVDHPPIAAAHDRL